MEQLFAHANERSAGTDIKYTQMRLSDIVSAIAGEKPSPVTMDMALLPSPDLGVQLANEGYLARIPAPPAQPHESHWRQEVFAVFYDPAVLVVRANRLDVQELPKNRQALVGFLEANADTLRNRVGLVNIGTAPQSYGFAVQDQLRSVLYWQLTQAIGDLNARVFETNQEIVAALQAGQIDLAYNVPLSHLAFAELNDFEIITMEDYTVALPWVAVAPPTAQRRAVADVVTRLRQSSELVYFSSLNRKTSSTMSWRHEFQRVKLGPELLVFLDPLKKTTVLESWLPAVTGQ